MLLIGESKEQGIYLNPAGVHYILLSFVIMFSKGLFYKLEKSGSFEFTQDLFLWLVKFIYDSYIYIIGSHSEYHQLGKQGINVNEYNEIQNINLISSKILKRFSAEP